MSLFTAKCGRCDKPLTQQDYNLRGHRTPHCHNCANRLERHRLHAGTRVRVRYEPSGAGASTTGHWPGPELKHRPTYKRLMASRVRKAKAA
jgi:hypothetical protein